MYSAPTEFLSAGSPLSLHARLQSSAPCGARRLALVPVARDPLVRGTTLGARAPESAAQSRPGRRDLLAESLGEALSEARSERARETGREPARAGDGANCFDRGQIG